MSFTESARIVPLPPVIDKRRNAMSHKSLIRLVLLAAVLAGSFAGAGSAHAGGYCGATYTVQWGDTLGRIASMCGVTVDALYTANPGLGSVIYAGQVVNIPSGTAPVYYPPAPSYGGTYVVQYGDTLRIIAARYGTTVSAILAVNPQIWNPNLIYVGQVINLPARPVYYTVCYGDTLYSIAVRYGTTVASLQYLNNLWNPNWIYAGQVLRIY
jgi:peptidoglycan endopeptidase LytE